MNDINMLLADNDNFKFVTVVFSPFTGRQNYTYKTLIPDIAEGDFAVVDTPNNGFAVVKVLAVVDPMEVNLDVNYSYKWVVQRIDPTEYESVKEREKELLRHINKAKNKVAVKAAKKAMLDNLPAADKATAIKLSRL